MATARKNGSSEAQGAPCAAEKGVAVMQMEWMRQYARVLVRRGLNVKQGQGIYLECPAEGEALAALIVEEAQRAGAGRVRVHLKSSLVETALLKCGRTQEDEAEQHLLDECAAQRAAFLRIETISVGTPEGVNAEAVSRKDCAARQQRIRYQKVSGGVQACIADLPTASWAKAVYPQLSEKEGLEKLWADVFACTRADRADAVAAWDEYIAATRLRKHKLDEKGYRRLRYVGAGTDLTISLHQGGKWQGGCMMLEDGTIYVPNIPTEEIFRAPHRGSAQGRVCATMPLNIQGTLVQGMWLEFENGEVVRYGASQGQDVLKKLLETDAGARRLGEVALVDQASPIAQRGRIFYSSLYDENASCHMAIGLAAGPKPPTEEQMAVEGLNVSAIHVDFMVGSDELDVFGQTEDGVWQPIFEKGHWVREFE